MRLTGCGTQSLARTRLRLLKSLAGLPPDAPQSQESMEEDTSYDGGTDSESTMVDSQGEEHDSTSGRGGVLREVAITRSR